MQEIDLSLREVAKNYEHANSDQPYGGYHIIFTGDFNQHKPVKGKPLYYGAYTKNVQLFRGFEKEGRRIWETIDSCIILEKQHRFDTSDPSGLKLLEMVTKIARESRLTREEVAAILDELNTRALNKESFQDMLQNFPPRAIVLRNELRPPLNACIIRHKARLANQQLFVWRSIHHSMTKTKLTQRTLSGLEKLPCEKTGGIPTVGYFYVGMEYKFLDSNYPMVGRMTNNSGIGRQLILDERECLADTNGKPYVILKYLPRAI
ncbi:MAG: hypothetical protein ACK5PF_10930, partial [bacterium]